MRSRYTELRVIYDYFCRDISVLFRESCVRFSFFSFVRQVFHGARKLTKGLRSVNMRQKLYVWDLCVLHVHMWVSRARVKL